MEKKAEIEKYFAKFLAGTIAEEEMLILKKWAERSPENKKLFDLFSLDDEMKKRFLDYYDLKSPFYWERMQSRVKKIKRLALFRKAGRIAAAILIPLAIASGVYMLTLPTAIDSAEKFAHIQPGIQKATLLLSNNMEIALDTVAIGQLQHENISTVYKESKGLLTYRLPIAAEDKAKELKQEYHTLNVARGEEYMLELSDGSKVWLNSESRISYPVRFSGNTREVSLEKGEAYFEVAHHPDKPFILTSGKSVIDVLGTRFNVSAYEGEDEIITLVQGSVDLRHRYDPDGISTVRLKPGDQANVVDINRKIRIEQVNPSFNIAWKDGVFFFNYENLDVIMKKLGRWYDFEVDFASKEVKSMIFFGKIKRYDNIGIILEMIKQTNKVNFSVKGNMITVEKI